MTTQYQQPTPAFVPTVSAIVRVVLASHPRHGSTGMVLATPSDGTVIVRFNDGGESRLPSRAVVDHMEGQ